MVGVIIGDAGRGSCDDVIVVKVVVVIVVIIVRIGGGCGRNRSRCFWYTVKRTLPHEQ